MGKMVEFKRPDGQSVQGYLAEPANAAGAPGCFSGCAFANASCFMQVSTMRRTVGNGVRSYLKKLQPTAWLTRQISAMVMASFWQ